MPQTIILIATFASTLGGASIALSTAIFYGVQGLLYAGLSVGLQLLSNLLFKPPAQRPEDVQQSTRQPLQFRMRYYGRNKFTGPWVFGETKQGSFYKVLALCQGPIKEIEEFWIDDNQVELDIDGRVTNVAPYDVAHRPVIEYRLGASTETPYTRLVTDFPGWTSAHVGNGIASLFAYQQALNQKQSVQAYPQGVFTNYNIVAKTSLIKNPVTDVVDYDDNAAAVIMDYMSHPEGMRLNSALFETPLAIEGWQAAYSRCNELIDLKAGGTEPAYRLWGGYRYDERPADVLGRMLASCDGKLKTTSDGGITLDVGTWAEPSVTIDRNSIIAFSDFGRGKNILQTANTIKATYLSEEAGFQTAEADPWFDDADVALRGEIAQEIALIMSPSHSQCRRLMKLEAYRRNPEFVANIVCNALALEAFGERFVRVVFEDLGIDHVFEVLDYKFNVGAGNILSSITMQIQTMPEIAYDWNGTLEEGTAPVVESSEAGAETIPVPTGFAVTAQTRLVSGYQVPYALLTFDAPPYASLTVEARYKRTADSLWSTIPVADDATTAESPILSDGTQYEFQIRYVSLSNRDGAWTSSINLTPVIDANLPLELSTFSMVGGNGRGVISFATAGGDSHLNRIAIYRAPTGVALNKTTHYVTRIGAAPGTTFSYTDGDSTIVNLLVNPDFAVDATWTKGTGWTIAAGKATKAAGTGSNLLQSGLASMTAVPYRYGVTASSVSAGSCSPFTFSTTVFGTAITTNGTKLGKITPVAASTSFGFNGNATFVGSLDDAVFFKETAACAPQGVWDYYAIPENVSGIEGPQSGPQTITIY